MDCEQPKRVTDQTCTYFRMYTFLCYLSEFEGLGLRNVYHPGHTFACRTWLHGECSHVDAVGTLSKPEVGGFVVLCKGVCEVLSITASTPSVVWRGPRPTTRIVFIFAPTVSSASWAILATTSTCIVNDERTKVAVLNHEDSGTRRHASGRSGRGHSDRLDNPFD